MLLANQIQNNKEQYKHSKGKKKLSSSYKSVTYGDAETARVLYNSPDLEICLRKIFEEQAM